jgi:hypothetical protein
MEPGEDWRWCFADETEVANRAHVEYTRIAGPLS